MTEAVRIFNRVHFSSEDMTWTTPRPLFDALHAEFGFTLDAAASHTNHLCERYYTEQDDGLTQDWSGVVWCNPPYGRAIGDWIRKAHHEARRGVQVVMLIPARTDTAAWHDYIFEQPGVTVRFLRGRLRFGDATGNAPFPSAVVVFNPVQIQAMQPALLGVS